MNPRPPRGPATGRLPLALAAGAGTACWLAAEAAGPAPALGHAIGQVFRLPIPLPFYLAGAGLAVAASFVVSALTVRPADAAPRYPTGRLPAAVMRAGSVLLQVLGLAWWFGAIAAGYLVDPISALPALLFWIGIWVALPIVAVLLGNPWPSLSPFRTLFELADRAARAAGLSGLVPAATYPAGLARWPAVALLFIALWCELVLPESSTPSVVASLMLGYTLLTLAGMAAFGRIAWLRNAELFEVLLGWFGRVGPVGRRAASPAVCQGCTLACDPTACVDCPECLAAAEPGELTVELRPWFAGLTQVRAAGPSDATFIVLALAGVTYDGLQETTFWGSLAQPLFEVAWTALGALNAVLAVQTAGLVAVWLVFAAAFVVGVALSRALRGPGGGGPGRDSLGGTAGTYAATLLPIAAGYLVAHYLTVVVQSGLWLPMLLADPLSPLAPNLDWFPAPAVWYLSVASIVLGHIVAIVLAHRLALRDAPSRATLAGLPLVALMVGYTVLSLWIIAAPITVDPDAPALAVARR